MARLGRGYPAPVTARRGPDPAADVVVTPDTVTAVAALPTPTVLAAATVTPTTVAAVAALPIPAILAAATATPAVVAVVAALPTPSVLAASVVTPLAVAVIAALPTPTAIGATAVNPSVIVTVVALPTPSILAAATVTPAVIVTLAALPTPTIPAPGDATAADPFIWIIRQGRQAHFDPRGFYWGETLFPDRSLLTGTVVNPARVDVTVALPTPALLFGWVATPAVIPVVVVLPSLVVNPAAGFEIPYLLGQGGIVTVSPATVITATSTFTVQLSTTLNLQTIFGGSSQTGRYPYITATEKTSIIATSSPSNFGTIAAALDGNLVNDGQFTMSTNQAVGQYMQFEFPQAERFVRIAQVCTQGTAYTTDYPRNWIIRGSNNGTTWTELAVGAASAAGVINTDIPFPGFYKYWRIELTSAAGFWWRVNEVMFYHNLSGAETSGLPLTLIGADRLETRSTGTGTFGAELFVSSTVNLAVMFAGTSTFFAWLNYPTANPRTYSSYLYHYVNVGVGFNPTDTYPGAVSQSFPDGHTRNDFHEYLYVYLNVGVGFNPTDIYPGAVAQTFPDGHTRNDFHEYLYLYLNVVLGIEAHGQLTILPGFTRGPTLPTGKPPRMEPA